MTIFVVDLHTLMESNKNINNCHFFFPDHGQACLMLISEELRKHTEKITKSKSFANKYNWEGINHL